MSNIQQVLKNVRRLRSKSKPFMSKSLSQKIHALRRFKERYGFELTPHNYKELCHLVMQSKAQVLEKQSNRVRKMKINFKGQDIYFCYDTQRHKINTFLKPEWVLNPDKANNEEIEKEIKEAENE